MKMGAGLKSCLCSRLCGQVTSCCLIHCMRMLRITNICYMPGTTSTAPHVSFHLIIFPHFTTEDTGKEKAMGLVHCPRALTRNCNWTQEFWFKPVFPILMFSKGHWDDYTSRPPPPRYSVDICALTPTETETVTLVRTLQPAQQPACCPHVRPRDHQHRPDNSYLDSRVPSDLDD